jgi:hypothetical protein
MGVSMFRPTAIALLAAFVFATAAQAQPHAANPLVGTWRVTEIADANKPPLTAPQPGLYIFTPKHYSMVRINGVKPLPDYPSNDKASDTDKVAVFNALYLQSGTYTLKDNILSIKALVAKSAFAMTAAGNQYDVVISGNTLVLTLKRDGSSVKLVRVE